MVDRPDLDEFLGALSGFVSNKNNLPQDPSYFRFLEIFCRSVGSSEGHLLQYVEGKGLHSVVSCGMPKEFDAQFNEVIKRSAKDQVSPLDRAFRDQRVEAVVDLKKELGIPIWFLNFVDKNRFKALVAVPLIGAGKAVGVLCAYYRDVCLFDQGTLDRLMTIGRMVGTAMENSSNAAHEGTSSSDHAVDIFLGLLNSSVITESHVFSSLVKAVVKGLAPSAIICGPLRMSSTELLLTVADGTGLPPNAISQKFVFPPLLAQPLLNARGPHRFPSVSGNQLGSFQSFMVNKTASLLVCPIIWRDRAQAAMLTWRSDKKPFTDIDEQLMGRFSAIAALALRTI